MVSKVQNPQSSIINPQSSIAQKPDFSQTLIAQGGKAAEANKIPQIGVKPAPFYQAGDEIYKKDKYRITAAPDGKNGHFTIYVNGKEHIILVDTTKGKLLVGQIVARMVKEGKFKDDALGWGENASGIGFQNINNRVTISALSNLNDKTSSDLIQAYQGKLPFGNVTNTDGLTSTLGRAAAKRGQGFDYVQVYAHGSPDGRILIGDTIVEASKMVEMLLSSGSLKKGGIIEFYSCDVGQDFNRLRYITKKFGVTIKAANDVQNVFGVVKGNIITESVMKSSGVIIPKELRRPVKGDILTFKPDGKVYGSDGKQIYKIEYEKKK